jgi:hypothetical protein
MLSLLIKYPRSWDTVISQAPSFNEFEQKLNKLHFMVVDISLVQHRGSEFLEDIILRSVLDGLGDEAAGSFGGTETRHETFSKLKLLL